VSSWACSEALACCTGMALRQAQHTLWGNNTLIYQSQHQNKVSHYDTSYDSNVSRGISWWSVVSSILSLANDMKRHYIITTYVPHYHDTRYVSWRFPEHQTSSGCWHNSLAKIFRLVLHAMLWNILASQRSLHNAPIFRLLLKVAVNGTHQCDFLNFCGGLGLQQFNYIRDASYNVQQSFIGASLFISVTPYEAGTWTPGNAPMLCLLQCSPTSVLTWPSFQHSILLGYSTVTFE